MQRILFMLFLSLFITACSMPAVPPVATPSPEPDPATPTVPAPTDQAVQVNTTPSVAQPTATPEPLRLIIWTTENAAGLDLLRALSDEYADAHDIIIEVIAKTPTALRVDMIANELAQDLPPDLIWGDQDDLAGLLIDGQLQPVNLPLEAEQFIPAVIASATHDAQVWGQPIVAQDYLLLLYNRAFIQQPPATTDELIVQARGVPDPAVGIVAGWSEAHWLLAWLNGYGGAATTPDGMQPTLNTPQMIDALNLVRELRAAAPPDQRTYADASQLFSTGQVAFAIDGDWSLPVYRNEQPGLDILDIGVAPMPRIPATNRLAAPPMGATYVMFHALLSPDKQAQAYAFADFLSQPETQLRVALSLRRLPVLRSDLQNPQISADPDLAAAVAQADAASGLPPTRALSCALRAINLYLPGFLDNQTDQAQTAQSMQQSADECLSK